MVAPAGGWRYTQPETGWAGSAITFAALLKKIAVHRANMGIETKGRLAEEIEAAICTSLSPEDRQACCVTGLQDPRPVHWSMVQRFLTTLTKWVKDGFQLVPQKEAERRAAICVKCPYNVTVQGCGLCKQTLALAREAALKRSTSYDDTLLACGICGCDNKTQVHVPLAALDAGSGGLAYPAEFCWKAAAGPGVRRE